MTPIPVAIAAPLIPILGIHPSTPKINRGSKIILTAFPKIAIHLIIFVFPWPMKKAEIAARRAKQGEKKLFHL